MKKVLLGMLLLSSLVWAKPVTSIDQAEMYTLSISIGQTSILTSDHIMGQLASSKKIEIDGFTPELAKTTLDLVCEQQNLKLLEVKTYDTGLVRALTRMNKRSNGYIGYVYFEIDTKGRTTDTYAFVDADSKN